MRKSDFMRETSKLIEESLIEYKLDGYSVEPQKGIFTALNLVVRGPEGMLKEYSAQTEFSLYKSINCSVSYATLGLRETILFDTQTLLEFLEFKNQKKAKESGKPEETLDDLIEMEEINLMENKDEE